MKDKELKEKIKEIDEQSLTFECYICKEKADDINDKTEYTFPLTELANPEEPDENFRICKTCYLDELNDKYNMKYDDEEF